MPITTSSSIPTNSHPAFKFVRQQTVESLNVVVQEFEHIVTGAQHIHLHSDSEENVFLVALRTVPTDSTGVAHILEHTALCGSEKYPVRDPFFMMTRRSLNTFMNAFTSSDWTAYPFASLNKKDFNNLLDVYLDAVFFARLDELDFAQEGHRLEFTEADNAQSPLQYKGVVFNEMKGAMSSVPSQLWQTLSQYLFPTSTYHFNSGGEPTDIPNLSYQQLVDFYKTHYHPSNAVFMTYGDIDAATHQQKFEEQALKKFQRQDKIIEVDDEKRYLAPVRVEEYYPNNEENIDNETHVVVAWLLGKSTDLDQSLRAQLLSSVLLDNSATPLMHQLESTELGSAPSPLCGLDDSQKEITFMCGLAGCATDSADKVEALIIETLEHVARNGIPETDIASALHQLELHQREIGGDSYPYGLQLILTALTNATHRGDPVKLLQVDAALAQLREEAKAPNFIQNLARELLLTNQHRVRLTLKPDNALSQRKDRAERAQLDAIQAQLSDTQREQIISQAQALKARQEQVDDESLLPKVTLEDVPEKEVHVTARQQTSASGRMTLYPTGTNGLVYQQCIYQLPPLTDTQLPLLNLYSSCVTELGAGDSDYLAMQKRQAQVTGGISAYASMRGTIDDVQSHNAFFVYSGKALNRNQRNLSEVMADMIGSARFNETSRIKEIISQIRMNREQRLTGNGHVLAMTAACAGMSPIAKLSHQLGGLVSIRDLRSLDTHLQNGSGLDDFCQNLTDIHRRIGQSTRQYLVVAEAEQLQQLDTALAPLTTMATAQSHDSFILPATQQTIRQAWLTNSQVNFCARAYPTVSTNHPDSPALVVLGAYLRNGVLHKLIREQGGAYGGGASQDSNNGCFRFYSYRDPRLAETLDDFDQSLIWLGQQAADAQKVEEAILGTISSIDKSESPAGRAKRCFHADLHGRSIEVRQRFRERVLAITFDDLVRVSETYLQPEKASTAIITDLNNHQQAEHLGLEIQEL